MEIKLNIINYTIDESTIESCFIFSLELDKNLFNYKLNLPSNPFLDIEILRLTELEFNDKILKLKKIVKNKEYSFKSLNSLTNFIIWINNIIDGTKIICK